MMNSKFFARELNLIADEDLRMAVEAYFNERVPKWFWESGASASGKFHPVFSQGNGGLVRHVKAVVMFAEELLRMSSYAYMPQQYKDYVIVACLIHDCAKYGMSDMLDKSAYKEHAPNGAKMFDLFMREKYSVAVSEKLLDAVRTHMGQWSEKEDKPFSPIDRCVHMADYMASRSFIDIPVIMDEYAEACEENYEFED
jgi:HD superfamily phosphohydrolase YqeK